MKKISRRSFLAASGLTIAALALTACGGSASTASSAASSVAASSEAASTSAAAAELTTVEAGKLTMATNATFPPYEMTTDAGTIEGIDVDTAQAIAEKLGLELQIDDMDFDAALLSVCLLYTSIDLVVARRTRDEGHIVHGHAAAGVMSLEGGNARVDAVGLGGDVAGRAAGAGTPVIEGVGDVDDLPGRLGQAEEELIILTAVVLHPLRAACGIHQPAAEQGQVADIVVGAEVVQHEIRLEVVEHHILHLALKGRLIGIDKVGSLLGDGLGRVPEGAGMEDVVVVQQGDEVAGGHLDALVGVARDELILLQLPVADTRVHSGALLHHLCLLYTSNCLSSLLTSDT